MKTSPSVIELQSALVAYRTATDGAVDEDDKAEYARLACIVETLISQIEDEQAEAAKQTAFAFSRSVTDGYATQPNEYRRLSEIVGRIRDMS
jgi:hypothetical protein